jgi:hypothetical protein
MKDGLLITNQVNLSKKMKNPNAIKSDITNALELKGFVDNIITHNFTHC